MNIPSFSGKELTFLQIIWQIVLISSFIFIRHVWDILRGRRKILTFSLSQREVAMSLVHPKGKAFETRWNDRIVECASLVRVEINNQSGSDIEDLDIVVTLEDAEYLIGEWCGHNGHGTIENFLPLEIKSEERYSVIRQSGGGWLGDPSRYLLNKHVIKFCLPVVDRYETILLWLVCQTNNRSRPPLSVSLWIRRKGFKVIQKGTRYSDIESVDSKEATFGYYVALCMLIGLYSLGRIFSWPIDGIILGLALVFGRYSSIIGFLLLSGVENVRRRLYG